jgi:hypothetical protein
MNEANENLQGTEALLQRTPTLALPTAEELRDVAGETRPAVGQRGISLFGCVLGGILLSIAALVVVALYQQLTSSAKDLRNDVARLKEARADLIKKDEFNARMNTVWNGLNDAKAAGVGVAAVREKQALQEQQLRHADEQRRELIRELQLLRERVATLEGRGSGLRPTTARDIPD